MQTIASVVLADVFARVPGLNRPVILGIVGPPGVGKSYAATRVAEALGRRGVLAGVVPMDGFHLSNAQLDQLGLLDSKGAPETFDVGGFVALLHRLRAGTSTEAMYVPDYDRVLHEPIAARRRIAPGIQVAVVEGNYLLHDAPEWSAVRELLDVAWYLDAPVAVRECRLVARQLAGGNSDAGARTWVERVDNANAEIIARGREHADYRSDSTQIDIELADRP